MKEKARVEPAEELRILIEDEAVYMILILLMMSSQVFKQIQGYIEDYPLNPEDYYTWIAPFKYLDNRKLRMGVAEINEMNTQRMI